MTEKDRLLEAAANFAKQQMGAAPVQPQLVQAQPCPMSVQIGQAQGADGNSYVLLIIHTMTGQNVFHFDADGADGIADAIKNAARQARTGLEIPRLT